MSPYSRKDTVQDRIVAELENEYDCKVASTADLRRGKPDIIVGYRGWLFWVELKSKFRANITEAEIKFLNEWGGAGLPVFLGYSAPQIVQTMDNYIDMRRKVNPALAMADTLRALDTKRAAHGEPPR